MRLSAVSDYGGLHPAWRLSGMTALKSLPGGGIQGVHADMDPLGVEAIYSETKVYPVIAIVAIMPGTSLRVYWGCYGVADRKRQCDLELKVGEMLIFRGDLAHCGLAYEAEHIRIHVPKPRKLDVCHLAHCVQVPVLGQGQDLRLDPVQDQTRTNLPNKS